MNQLTDQELETMLEKAAEAGAGKALEKLTNQLYQEIGKTVMKRFLQTVGGLLIAVAIYAWNHGWIK
jgi:hypothetical protein